MQQIIGTRRESWLKRAAARLARKLVRPKDVFGIVVKPFMGISRWLWRFWDVKVVDGLVNGVGYSLEAGSAILKLFQTGFVGTYALWITLGVIALFLHFLR